MRFLPSLLLLLTLPAAAADEATAEEDDALAAIAGEPCEAVPADTGLRHLRCGPTRILVAQLSPVKADVHDELLTSVLDLVPTPATRAEVPGLDPDLRVTRVVQSRADLQRDEVSVLLVLTTRHSTGRSVACAVGQVGRKRIDRAELDWCARVTDALLPAPEAAPTTRIEVEEPELFGGDDLEPAEGLWRSGSRLD